MAPDLLFTSVVVSTSNMAYTSSFRRHVTSFPPSNLHPHSYARPNLTHRRIKNVHRNLNIIHHQSDLPHDRSLVWDMFPTGLKTFFGLSKQNPTPLVWLLNPQLFDFPANRHVATRHIRRHVAPTTTKGVKCSSSASQQCSAIRYSRSAFPGLYFTDNNRLPTVDVPLEELPRDRSAVWA